MEVQMGDAIRRTDSFAALCHAALPIILRSLTRARPEFAGFNPGFGSTKEWS
jgi:hypothetical protein